MNWAEIGCYPGELAAVYLGLVLFGVGYNWLTERAEHSGLIRGYTSIFVVGGVVITVGAMALIDVHFAIMTLIAFAASGTPMIIGEMVRHWKRNRAAQLRREARSGDDNPR